MLWLDKPLPALSSQACWHTPGTPALGKQLKKEKHNSEGDMASLGCKEEITQEVRKDLRVAKATIWTGTLCTEVRRICKHRKITHFWHLTSIRVDFYTQCIYRPHTPQIGVGREKICLRVKTLRVHSLEQTVYNHLDITTCFMTYHFFLPSFAVTYIKFFKTWWTKRITLIGVQMESLWTQTECVTTPLPNILGYLSF